MYITVNIQLQPGFVDVGTPAPVQIQTMVLDSHLQERDRERSRRALRPRSSRGTTSIPPDRPEAPRCLRSTFGAGVTVTAGGTATLNNSRVLPVSAIQGFAVRSTAPVQRRRRPGDGQDRDPNGFRHHILRSHSGWATRSERKGERTSAFRRFSGGAAVSPLEAIGG